MTKMQTKPVDRLVEQAAWELQRYQTVLPPNQRSIRARLVNMAPDLKAKQQKKHKDLNVMYDFMANPAKWNALDPMVQNDRWEQFHRTLKEYERLCDCVAGIEALRR